MSEAQLELKNPDLLATSLLLFPLSTAFLYTSRTRGIKARTNSSELKQPWKALQSLPGLSITCWQSQQKRQEIRPLVITLFLRKPLGLLIGFAGLEMNGHCLFLCQEEVWQDQAQAWQFHGLKAYSTRIMHPLHSLPTSCLQWPLQNKWNHHWIPGFVISWECNCEACRVRIRHVNQLRQLLSEEPWRAAAVVLLAVKSRLTCSSCSVLCVVPGPSLGLITIHTSWAKKAFFIQISLLPLIQTFRKYYYAPAPTTSSVKHIRHLAGTEGSF